MSYKLKNKNGRVTFLLRTGKDLVRNQMALASAQHIIDHGEVLESFYLGFPINVDDKWYFEGELVKSKKPDEKLEGSKGEKLENRKHQKPL